MWRLRSLATTAVLVAILLAGPVLADPVLADPVAAQDDDIPDACRTIIGCADAGPEPENPGDRGGYAQLLTLVVLAGGVGFILVRVGLAVRDGDRRSTS